MYRDERMFCLNLARGKVTRGSEQFEKWILTTYENTHRLPPIRVDEFETRDEAISYIKKVEPTVPLHSNNGQSLAMPDGVDRWEYWTNWLDERGLKSAVAGFHNVPRWAEGISRSSEPVEVIQLSREELSDKEDN